MWPRLYFEFVVYAARNPDFREELSATAMGLDLEELAEVMSRPTEARR